MASQDELRTARAVNGQSREGIITSNVCMNDLDLMVLHERPDFPCASNVECIPERKSKNVSLINVAQMGNERRVRNHREVNIMASFSQRVGQIDEVALTSPEASRG